MIYIFTYRTNELEFVTSADSDRQAWENLEKACKREVQAQSVFGKVYTYLCCTHPEFWVLAETEEEGS